MGKGLYGRKEHQARVPQNKKSGSGKGQGLQEHGRVKRCGKKQGGWGGAGLGGYLR